MKYNIVNIADVHWDVIDADIQEEHLEFIFIYLEEMCKVSHIDLLVILGDYWNSKSLLNSKPTITALNWLPRLVNKAIELGIKKFRIFKGTKDHDNSQLESFRYLEDESGYFKIFNTTTSEETLPGLQCIYCPDENISNEEYYSLYIDEMLKGNNIGFFHGSFDIVLPDFLVNSAQAQSNVMYEYNRWQKLINGPLLAGHWHDGKEYGDLNYIGSPDCWKFNENEPKGIGFVQYDTETHEYFYKKILNILAPTYLTYECYTNSCDSMDAYQVLMKEIDTKLAEFENSYTKVNIRIMIYMTDDKPSNETYITALRQYYSNDKRIKLKIKDKLKDKKKKEEIRHNVDINTKFGFVSDKKKTPADIIHQFILATKEKDVPIEFIETKVNKYINY